MQKVSNLNSFEVLGRETFLDEDLLGTFKRLDIVTMEWKRLKAPTMWQRETRSHEGTTRTLPKMPETFTTIKQARQLWTDLIHVGFQWHAEHQNQWNEKIFQWFLAFKPLFESSRERSPASTQYLGANILMINYITIHTAEAELLDNGERPIDSFPIDPFTEYYTQSLDLATTVLETPGDHCGAGKMLFAFDDDLIRHIFFIAMRSREGDIRRRAMALLFKYPRREAVCNGTVAGVIAAWVIDMEESDAGGIYIPAESKLKVESINYKLGEWKVMIHYSKMGNGGKAWIRQPPAILKIAPNLSGPHWKDCGFYYTVVDEREWSNPKLSKHTSSEDLGPGLRNFWDVNSAISYPSYPAVFYP
jgi:hypothetical protein